MRNLVNIIYFKIPSGEVINTNTLGNNVLTIS